MKARGIKPTVLTYNCLIRACGRLALPKQAIAIYEDMLAAGLQPGRETFHLLFEVSIPPRIYPGASVDFETGPLARIFEYSAGVVG